MLFTIKDQLGVLKNFVKHSFQHSRVTNSMMQDHN